MEWMPPWFRLIPASAAAAVLKVMWPDTEAGKAGVERRGDQLGSAWVAGLPSRWAWRIAALWTDPSDSIELTPAAYETLLSAGEPGPVNGRVPGNCRKNSGRMDRSRRSGTRSCGNRPGIPVPGPYFCGMGLGLG